MKVSIIIPVYNARKTIGRVIEACMDINHDDKEIILVDDGSTDGSWEIASRYPIKLLRQRNQGPAKARNEGWKAGDGEVCFFTDADCLPRADVLTILLKYMKDPKTGGAGGTYENANPQYLLSRLIHSEISDRHRQMTDRVDFLGSFNCLYRRKALEEVDGFNETYTSASAEDNDLSYRVVDKGWNLAFDARAAVSHFHETSVWNYLYQQFNHGKWRVKLYMDHANRKRGDVYAGVFDFIQPLLALLLFIELPILFFETARPFYLAILAFYTFLQFPRPIEISLKTGRIENILLAPLTFMRGIARGLGLGFGFLKFGL